MTPQTDAGCWPPAEHTPLVRLYRHRHGPVVTKFYGPPVLVGPLSRVLTEAMR